MSQEPMTSQEQSVSLFQLLTSTTPPPPPTVDNPSVTTPAQPSTVAGDIRYAPYKGKGKPRTPAQKERKKEHNRKSASKYRSKKKQEAGVQETELQKVEEKNTQLKKNVEDL